MGLYTVLTPGELAAAGVVLPVVGAGLVALRLYRQKSRFQKLSTDDWLVIPALAFMWGMGIACLIVVGRKTEGYDEALHNPANQPNPEDQITSKVFWNIQWMQPLALGCIKLSFVFFYRRIFIVGEEKSIFNILSMALAVLVGIWMIGFFLACMLICPGHVDAYWGPAADREKYCWKTTNFLYTLCWSDVATDLTVLLLPIAPISRLHLTNKMKVGIAAVFALGALAVAASITRAVFYMQLLGDEADPVAYLDPDMLDSNGIYWLLLETGLALIAVNLPLLYGSFKSRGIDAIVRSVRSLTSLHSQLSNRGNSPNTSSIHKKATGAVDNEGFELTSRTTHSLESQVVPATPSKSSEGGKDQINITTSYAVQSEGKV